MSKNIFNSVQYPTIGSNTFDLSHDVKMSFQMGGIYPTLCMDIIPGDRIRLSTETMLRFAPLIAPVMHMVNVTTHFFFVPNRILWPNWERWITGDLETEAPYITTVLFEGGDPTPFPLKSLADYLGLPTATPGISANDGKMGTTPINALPVAAYVKIWDEYYRDQNLQDERFTPLVDGDNNDDDPNAYNEILRGPCFRRAWNHDYFTAALPFAQKGEAVSIPLGNFNNVPVAFNFSNPGDGQIRRTGPGPLYAPQTGQYIGSDGTNLPEGVFTSSASGSDPKFMDPNGSLIAMTEQLVPEAADINSLRRAFRLQEWLERNARGGTRYIENIMAHFGVRSSDARLQRPEYLGGSKQKMVISEVLSTAETEVPVAQMAGHGISVGSGREFTYRAEEHGWIIGLINVQPLTAYQQGLHRKFTKLDRLEYYWPSFAHIGEQEVHKREVNCQTDDMSMLDEVFGYVPRYAEYRFENSRVAGDFRDSLIFWHLGRYFGPTAGTNLNSDFITANPSDRIFAVIADDQDKIYGHIFNRITALRKMPKYGTPTF